MVCWLNGMGQMLVVYGGGVRKNHRRREILVIWRLASLDSLRVDSNNLLLRLN